MSPRSMSLITVFLLTVLARSRTLGNVQVNITDNNETQTYLEESTVQSHSLQSATIDIECLAKTNYNGSQALDNFPLIDGHNDLAFNIYMVRSSKINNFELNTDLTNDALFGKTQCAECDTDLVRMKKGKIGAQFWSAYVDCKIEGIDVLQETLNAIDLIKRVTQKYPDILEFVTTADGILDVFKRKKIASLIGVEGGHSIRNSMAVLRTYYELGARYMTLTHTCNLEWADASTNDERNPKKSDVGLYPFGEAVVKEMNRLGMMVDLSHTSHRAQLRALEVTGAPVIFSHSSVYAIRAHPRNVHDDVLKKLKENGGIIMINFYQDFLTTNNVSTIHDVAAHINYVADLIGFDYVGIGADFDGVTQLPSGLDDVSKYPDLFDLLHEMDPFKWTMENLEKLAGRNLIRVFKKVEEVKEELKSHQPYESTLEELNLNSGTFSVDQVLQGIYFLPLSLAFV